MYCKDPLHLRLTYYTISVSQDLIKTRSPIKMHITEQFRKLGFLITQRNCEFAMFFPFFQGKFKFAYHQWIKTLFAMLDGIML